jgi:hypothetical protein
MGVPMPTLDVRRKRRNTNDPSRRTIRDDSSCVAMALSSGSRSRNPSNSTGLYLPTRPELRDT